jgi:N-acetylneuraminic acid mutarotase
MWTELPPAPFAPRRSHSAVWTGGAMLVYGGLGLSVDCPQACALGDGVAYDPIGNSWKPLAPAPLAARSGHSAVWVQNRMVVWGGAAEGGGTLNDGASYDPTTDTWTALPPSPLAPRVGHRTVATTHQMLVWGGSSQAAGGTYFADGAVYSPTTNGWMATASAPSSLAARDNFAAVWAGDQMLVWGGPGLGDGAAYDLESDSWTAMAPSPLSGRTAAGAVWTGRDMLVWGGFDGAVQSDGALYDPTDDAWARLSPGPLPPRQRHAMVWTGRQLLIWGGDGSAGKLSDGAVMTLRAR